MLVESDDVEFYGAIRDILTDYGLLARDARAIKASPTLVFLPASVGLEKRKSVGVRVWFHNGLKSSIKHLSMNLPGVIDRDAGNTSTLEFMSLPLQY